MADPSRAPERFGELLEDIGRLPPEVLAGWRMNVSGVALMRYFDRVWAQAAQHQPGSEGAVASRQWARSGSKPTQREHPFARPPGSWDAAVDRARRDWDALTGGPAVDRHGGRGVATRAPYSDVAAAAILRTALGLWPDVAARMAEGDPPQ